ncbi:MAG: hypothetical protein J3R72DRAFT_456949 [Linnemannia gamsii]|nr:MAG: hypothetical protein J3R72DRAFT_456949 [Linnemannia gamsii]
MFHGVDAKELTFWRGSIADDNIDSAITVDALGDKTPLNNPRSGLSKLFPESPDDNTYILVKRPPPAHAPIPIPFVLAAPLLSSMTLVLVRCYLVWYPVQIGYVYTDIKKTTEKFFTPGPIVDFLNAFMRGEGKLPVTKMDLFEGCLAHGVADRKGTRNASEPSLLGPS